ncbi:autotransporter outer membrane beta-barrel domain-containing protein [Salmonella enterica]|nr:autotransporter outer membrane beta-barrel domain-containing protein [Salmonella enterica]ELP9537391.1 autotransporter outer membrane beta-barrel domain-containing protein [Salmonella enterica]
MLMHKNKETTRLFCLSPVCVVVGICLYSLSNIPVTQAKDIYIRNNSVYLPGMLSKNDNVYIGSGSGNDFLVNDGNKIYLDSAYIGTMQGEEGSLTVSGNGTEIRFLNMKQDHNNIINLSNLLIGGEGNGTLSILDGASVTAGDTVVDNSSGIHISGTGSSLSLVFADLNNLNLNSKLVIGDTGEGILTIENGGNLTSSKGPEERPFYFSLGSGKESKGTVTVSGTDSKGNASSITTSALFAVGDAGEGTLTVDKGGLITNTNGGFFLGGGNNTKGGGQGIMTVSGAGSLVTNSGDLVVGNTGTGTLNIAKGGKYVGNSNVFTIGAGEGSKGAVTVSGADSKGNASSITTSALIAVGDAGEGTLTVDKGGLITDTYGGFFLGGGNNTKGGGQGIMTVSGTGSLVTNGGWLMVGNTGTGTLNIENGGKFVNHNGIFTLGSGKGSNGTVTVSGTDSKGNASSITTPALIAIGDAGEGTLTVDKGGIITNTFGGFFLGGGNNTKGGGQGIMTVSGAGSVVNNHGWAIIGNTGKGILVVGDNGELRDSTFFELGRNLTGEGTLVIGALPGSNAQAPGILNKNDSIHIGDGAGHIVFNHTGSDFLFNHNLEIDGNGKLDISVLNGTTTLTTTAWNGDTTLSGGKLILGNQTSLGNGDLTFNGGTLDLGAGTGGYNVKALTLLGGTLNMNLNSVTCASCVNTKNLYTDSDIYIKDILTGTSLSGTPASISLNNTGSDISTIPIIDSSGAEIGQGYWGGKLAQKNNSLGVAFGLQRVSLNSGKVLDLNIPTADKDTAYFDAVLDGAGGISLDASKGTIVFGNIKNSYSGSTYLKSGALNLAASHALGKTSGLTLAENTTLNLQGSIQSVGAMNTGTGSQINLDGGSFSLTDGGIINGMFSGSGVLNFEGGSTLLTSPSEGLTAQTDIEEGADVVLGASNALGNGSVTVNGKLILGSDIRSQTLSNELSGSGTLINRGEWILDHDNNYSDGTTVERGTLTLLTARAAGEGHINVLKNSGLKLAGNNITPLSLKNNVTGNGEVIKAGSGTWYLDHDNSYSGGTRISQGCLVLRSAGAAGTGGIRDDAELKLDGISGNISNALTGNGQLTLVNSSVSALALSGFKGALTVGEKSILNSSSDALLSLGSAVVDGILTAGGTTGQSVVWKSTLTGHGTLALSAGDSRSDYALSGLDNFEGKLSLQNGIYTLKDTDSTEFSHATLVSKKGNTLILDTQKANALSIGGGTLQLINNTPVTVASLNMTGGTLKADLSGLGKAQINTDDLFTNGEPVIRTLIHATDGMKGSVGNMVLSDSSGTDLSPLSTELNDAEGHTVGHATWGVKLGQKNNDLNLSYGLQGVNINAGKTLTLDRADSGSDKAIFNAVLSGSGGVRLDAEGGEISLGNMHNSYSGNTDLIKGTLNLTTSQALGNTAVLNMASGTILNLRGNSQQVEGLKMCKDSLLSLDGGTFVSSGLNSVEGHLTGKGTLAFTGGNSLITTGNSDLQATVNVARPATVTLTQANSIGTGAVQLDGELHLQGTVGVVENTLKGAGRLILDSGHITLNGDNNNFNGLLTIADKDAVLRVSAAENLGQSDVNNSGTLEVNTSADWMLKNMLTGNGAFVKKGNGTLTMGNTLKLSGLTRISEGTLVLSQGSDRVGQLFVDKGATLASAGILASPVILNGTLSALNAIEGYTEKSNSNLTLEGPLNNNALIDLTAASGIPGNTLTLSGAVSSRDGAIRLSTVMGDDTSTTDRIILQGATLNGQTNLIIHNAGGVGGQTQKGIEVVSVKGGTTTKADSFVLDGRSDGYRMGAGTLTIGAYDYSLTRGGDGGDASNWYLTSAKHLRPETGVYLMNREVTQSLMDAHLEEGLRDSEGAGVWLRTGGDVISHNEVSEQKVTARTRALNLGVDLLKKNLHRGYVRAGVMLGTGSATTWSHSQNNVSARGTVKGMFGGFYGRWTAEKEARYGLSVEGTLQSGHFSNSVQGDGLESNSYRTKVTQAGIRGGYAFSVYSSGKDAVTLTPEFGLTGSHYDIADFTESGSQTRVSNNNHNVLTSVAGLRWQGTLQVGNAMLYPYLETRWVHDSKEGDLHLNEDKISSKSPRSRISTTLGLNTLLKPNLSVSFSINSEMGAANFRSWGGEAGIKYHF